MIQGWLREARQVSLARRVVDELNPPRTYEGTVEVELASGMVIEEDMYSGADQLGRRVRCLGFGLCRRAMGAA